MHKKLLVVLFFLSSFAESHAGVTPYVNVYVVRSSQWPKEFNQYHPQALYVICALRGPKSLLSADTITRLKPFLDSVGNASFRLVFGTDQLLDSLWHFNARTKKLSERWINLHGNRRNLSYKDYFKIYEYDSAGTVRKMGVYDGMSETLAGRKFLQLTDAKRKLSARRQYLKVVPQVWAVSVGINDYGSSTYSNCQTDAATYVDFIQNRIVQEFQEDSLDNFHPFLLLDRDATRNAILDALRVIVSQAGKDDILFFNFSGASNRLTIDSITFRDYFFPYDVTGGIEAPVNRNTQDSSNVFTNLISLNQLLEFFQLIPATHQLIVSELVPSAAFKKEFIKTMLKASIDNNALNKNRILVLPNNIGEEYHWCQSDRIQKGLINYSITSLDSTVRFFDLFKEYTSQDVVALRIREKQYACGHRSSEYFDVFQEKKFIAQYQDLFQEAEQTRGISIQEKLKDVAGLNGNHHALIIGTDNYKAKGWDKLKNPVYDASEIADVLQSEYGFDVQLMKDPPIDSVYSALIRYARTLQPKDQFVLYFAGHGDFDEQLMDDGFIVCSDSKPTIEDPVRNSYLQHSKLKRMINKIPARQILVVLDICHGGSFDEEILGKTRDNGTYNIQNRNVMQFLREKSQLQTRLFLSSVGNESAFDGRAGKHSPFANLLLQVLRARGEGTNGIITLSDVFSVLQKQSLNETESLRISPHRAGFGSNNAQSEFILIPIEKEEKR